MKQLILRPLPWLVCLALAVAAYILRFHLYGYSFSAMVCCGLIALIAFYEGCHLLLPLYPGLVLPIRRIVTGILAAGLLVAGITEAIIIQASFGTPNDTAPYMVVLGAKIRTTGPSASLWDRIYGAYDYLAAHPEVTAIVSGGQGPDEPMTEALAMYQELVALGIDPARIWIEDKATSTWENLNFSLDLIEEKTGQRPTKLAVVSSEYHLFRSSLFAKACGVDFVGVPAKTSRMGQTINHFLREIAGVWHFWLLGSQYE